MKNSGKQTENQPQQQNSQLIKSLTAQLEKAPNETLKAAIREKIRAVKSGKPIIK